MRNTSNYSLFYLLLLAMFMLTGCVEDQPASPENGDFGDEVELIFNYTVPGMETVVKTRMTEVQEQTVTSVRIIVYRVEGDEEIYVYNRLAVLTGNNTEVSGSFRVRLAKSEADEKYTYDVLFNATTGITTGTSPALSKLEPGVTTRSEAREILQYSSTSLLTFSALPMWAGITKDKALLIDKYTQPEQLKVIRSMVRLDVGLNLSNDDISQGLDNFTLTYVRVMYGNSVLSYIPDPATISDDGIVIGPTILDPYPYNSASNGFSRSISNDAIIANFYFFEPKVDFINNNNKFTIVVQGNYTDEVGNTTTQYYPIRLMDPDNPGQLLNMIRNHKYRINITSIQGPGYSSQGNAAQGEIMNVIYDLSVSEEGDINHIVYNGAYFLGVSQVNYNLPGTVNSAAGEIKVKTNYPTGWRVALTDQDGNTVPTSSNLIRLSTTSSSAEKTTTNINFLSTNSSMPQTYYATFTAGPVSIIVSIIKNGMWYIYSDYVQGTYMNGEGDAYYVAVWGNVPSNLRVRAYSPLRGEQISSGTLIYPGGVVGVPQEDWLEITGNTWIPVAVRQVYFQYSTDGVTWVTFEKGLQRAL